MTKSLNLGHSVDLNSLTDMSKSLAGFHLTNAGAGSKAMHESTMDQVIKLLLYCFKFTVEHKNIDVALEGTVQI